MTIYKCSKATNKLGLTWTMWMMTKTLSSEDTIIYASSKT